MKISMMNTEQAADALVRMAQPVANNPLRHSMRITTQRHSIAKLILVYSLGILIHYLMMV